MKRRKMQHSSEMKCSLAWEEKHSELILYEREYYIAHATFNLFCFQAVHLTILLWIYFSSQVAACTTKCSLQICLKFISFFDQFRSYLRVLVFYSFEFHSRMCVLLNCFVYTIQYQITHLNDYYLTISEARYGSKTFFSLSFHHHITNLYKYMYYNIYSE